MPRPSGKTTISTTAHTKSGTAVADSPPREMTRSRAVPSFSAAYTPPTMASGTTMTNASSASLAELTMRVADDVGDRPLLHRRLAEVAGEDAGDPVPVLHEEVAVRAELVVQRVDRLLVGERAEDVAGDVAGQHLGGDEDDDAEDEQRDEAEQDPA